MRPAGDFFFIQLSNTRVIQHFLGGFSAGIMFTALKKEGYNDKISSLTHVKKEKCHNPLKILGCGTSHHGIDIW